MRKVSRWWMAVVLGVLLMVTMVGVAGAKPGVKPQAAAVTMKITIPAAAFYPSNQTFEYDNWGFTLFSGEDGSDAYFIAPVEFPFAWTVTVEKMEFIFFDNNSVRQVCATLYRTNPSGASEGEMANVCSGGSASSSTDPRTFSDTTIANSRVYASNGAYIWLKFTDDTNLRVYGVKIYYHRGT